MMISLLPYVDDSSKIGNVNSLIKLLMNRILVDYVDLW